MANQIEALQNRLDFYEMASDVAALRLMPREFTKYILEKEKTLDILKRI